MRRLRIIALLLAPVVPLGCGGGNAPAPAAKLDLTAEQVQAIAEADSQVGDEEQGQKITKPTKGAAKKK